MNEIKNHKNTYMYSLNRDEIRKYDIRPFCSHIGVKQHTVSYFAPEFGMIDQFARSNHCSYE